MKRPLLLSSAMLALLLAAGDARAHCEIPCGIYDEDARYTQVAEDLRTIEKSMAMIDSLSADPATNANQLARWVANKEHHADRIQETVAQYFLTQRVKVPGMADAAAMASYHAQLAALHKMLVSAMKCKQTTDPAHAKAVHDAMHQFKKAYTK